MSVKITNFQIENVKRVKVVHMSPSESGLTIIGGDNGQGKTSILDAIAWALGGDRFKPSEAQREGALMPPYLSVTLSNGVVVERKGRNSALKVMDPNGTKSGQQLLNDFVESFALDLPKFLAANNKEKANALLRVIGVESDLKRLNREEEALYNERFYVGRNADQKKKFASEMQFHPDLPQALVSISDLILQQQEILAKNGENNAKRGRLSQLQREEERVLQEVLEMQKRLEDLQIYHKKVVEDVRVAQMDAMDLLDESTEELEKSIANIEQTNNMIRENLSKERAEEEAVAMRGEYDKLSGALEAKRKEKYDLLQKADLPLEGLSVADGELVYNGFKWDNLSGSEQLKVATAIVRKINPKCGFVLLDKLEQMDVTTISDFAKWAESEGLQVIGTRVSTGDECSIIIEDGIGVDGVKPIPAVEKTWKAGEF